MSISLNETNVSEEPAALRAWIEKRRIFVEIHDGRIVGFPAARFRKLSSATEKELKEVKIEVNGYALRWDNLDEDINVPGIVNGIFELPPEE